MIALILAEGFEEVEAVTPVDLLRRAGIKITIIGIGGKLITGARGITIRADMEINDIGTVINELEGVIIPGGLPGADNIAASEKAISLINSINEKEKLVAAICAAPSVVLQKAGILHGKKVTGYPSCKEDFQDDVIYVDNNVVVDGNIITSKGVGTAGKFAIKIIEILKGKKIAEHIYKATLQG